MRKLCENYAEIMLKLCENYAKIMRTLCVLCILCKTQILMRIMRKLCENYAEIMRPLCGHVAPDDYAKIMRNYAKIMRIMRTSKNYADYADPTLLMAPPLRSELCTLDGRKRGPRGLAIRVVAIVGGL